MFSFSPFSEIVCFALDIFRILSVFIQNVILRSQTLKLWIVFIWILNALIRCFIKLLHLTLFSGVSHACCNDPQSWVLKTWIVIEPSAKPTTWYSFLLPYFNIIDLPILLFGLLIDFQDHLFVKIANFLSFFSLIFLFFSPSEISYFRYTIFVSTVKPSIQKVGFLVLDYVVLWFWFIFLWGRLQKFQAN